MVFIFLLFAHVTLFLFFFLLFLPHKIFVYCENLFFILLALSAKCFLCNFISSVYYAFYVLSAQTLVVFRNPKDTLVSYYHFSNNNPVLPAVKWDSFFNDFMSGNGEWGCVHTIGFNAHFLFVAHNFILFYIFFCFVRSCTHNLNATSITLEWKWRHTLDNKIWILHMLACAYSFWGCCVVRDK